MITQNKEKIVIKQSIIELVEKINILIIEADKQNIKFVSDSKIVRINEGTKQERRISTLCFRLYQDIQN